MAKISVTLLAAAVMTVAVPAFAQQATPRPGAADIGRVKAGNYVADARHSQVAWKLNHQGFNTTFGLFGMVAGTLKLDPAKPSEASVAIEIPINAVQTSVPALVERMLKSEILDAAQFPTATFKSTSVTVQGTTARITGDFTLHGVTKTVTLDAKFIGAGINPINKKETVGFEASTSINRSDYGINYLLPAVANRVDLDITIAWERSAG